MWSSQPSLKFNTDGDMPFLPGKRHKNPAYDVTPPAPDEARDSDGNTEAKWPPKMPPPRSAQPDPSVVEAAKVLGVDVDATEEEIISAFRQKVREVHPDLGGNAEATRRVIDARDVMLSWFEVWGQRAA